MLKKILLIFSFLLVASMATVSAENWLLIKTMQDRSLTTDFYIDTDRIQNNGTIATVWIKAASNGKTGIYMKQEFYRNSRSVKDLYIIFPGKNGEPDKLAPIGSNSEVTPVKEGYPTEAIYNYIWPKP